LAKFVFEQLIGDILSRPSRFEFAGALYYVTLNRNK